MDTGWDDDSSRNTAEQLNYENMKTSHVHSGHIKDGSLFWITEVITPSPIMHLFSELLLLLAAAAAAADPQKLSLPNSIKT